MLLMNKMARFTRTSSTCGTLLLLFGWLIELSLAQFDPIKDFCRRFGHQSAVVDDKLYVDGGIVNWKPYSETSANISSAYHPEEASVDGRPLTPGRPISPLQRPQT